MYVDFLCNKLKMPLQLTALAVENINSQVQDEQIASFSRKIMHSIMQVVRDSYYYFLAIIALIYIEENRY